MPVVEDGTDFTYLAFMEPKLKKQLTQVAKRYENTASCHLSTDTDVQPPPRTPPTSIISIKG